MKDVFKFIFIVGTVLSLPIKDLLACQLKRSVISHSAPITSILEEINLLKDPKLEGISTFYPLNKKNLHLLQNQRKSKKGRPLKIIKGGIYLSHRNLSQERSHLVFYDESMDLKKLFEQYQIKSIEIRARGKTTFDALDEALEKLLPYLDDCDQRVATLKQEFSKLEQDFKASLPNHREIIFFLGEIKNKKKLPELIIANDGMVKYLVENQKIKTYKTSLSYIPWSEKILMEKIKNRAMIVGLNSSADFYIGRNIVNLFNERVSVINASGPHALVPTLKNIVFYKKLMKNMLIKSNKLRPKIMTNK